MPSIVRIARNHCDDRPTTGKLYAGDLEFETLELPWKDNQPNVSCIPNGLYELVMDLSKRFGKIMPHALGVPGRTGIRIHGGEIEANTEGCPMVGLTRRDGPDGLGVDLTGGLSAAGQFYQWLTGACAIGKVVLQVYVIGTDPDDGAAT